MGHRRILTPFVLLSAAFLVHCGTASDEADTTALDASVQVASGLDASVPAVTLDAGAGSPARDAALPPDTASPLDAASPMDAQSHRPDQDGGSDASRPAPGDAAAHEGGASPGSDAASPPARPDAGADGGTFHVFLLLGQSNMAGYPKAQAADKAVEPRIRVLGYDDCSATGRRKDAWANAVPPLHECWNGAIGPGDYFAKTLLAALPPGDSIGLVPCAISGEKIETFLKAGGAKYSWIVERAKLAQKAAGVIEGILFHQGESNCNDRAWPGKVKTLVSDLKADLGLGAVPFLAGELVPTGACAAHNTLVGQLPSLIPGARVVSAQGLVLDPADTQWRLHFDHDSQVTFGKRYAASMREALQW